MPKNTNLLKTVMFIKGVFFVKWLLTCSIDAINVDYMEVLESDLEPDFWTCDDIANDHGCEFWTVSEFEEV